MTISTLLVPHKEKNTWKWGLLILLFLAPFFFLTYGFANQYAASLSHVPSIMFSWEKYIPLWSWTIVPYWSIDLFYGLSLLLCWNRFELKQHAFRLFVAQLISVTFFILFPLKFAMNRPELHGFFGIWFDVLMGFDKPFNQAPSLHIVLLVILWDFYRRHSSNYWKYLVDFWSLLIGVSVLTTWQHHFIDIPTGIIVGALCLWLFPVSTVSPFSESTQIKTAKHLKLGCYYAFAALLFIVIALSFKGITLWLLYPVLSLILVAVAYCSNKVHLFQKQKNGDTTIASQILFAPYSLFALINSRLWTRKHPEDSFIINHEGLEIYLGRFPNTSQQQHYDALFDCCTELPRKNTKIYHFYPTFDLIPLQFQQLESAAQNFQTIIQHAQAKNAKKLLIYCALGYSRSSAILIAWLIQHNKFHTIDEALAHIKTTRPWIVLNQVQLKELSDFMHNTTQVK